jgi:hypothetical protein
MKMIIVRSKERHNTKEVLRAASKAISSGVVVLQERTEEYLVVPEQYYFKENGSSKRSQSRNVQLSARRS